MDELLAVASEGRLSKPEVLEEQARRMLLDVRSEALGERFAAQWLRLQDMAKVKPDLFWYPDFTQQIELDMRRETQLFFNNLVREDRDVLELYNANYTFLNERLASHYGIRGVVGGRVPAGRIPSGGRAKRSSGSWKRAASDLDGEPDVAGQSGEMGDGGAVGHTAAAASACDSGSGGDVRRCGRWAASDGKGTVGGPSREPGVHVLPSVHRSDRGRVGELRHRRNVATQGKGHRFDDRQQRDVVRRPRMLRAQKSSWRRCSVVPRLFCGRSRKI